ncbi:MAG: hypothetical protein RXR19_04545 [Nitrososphaeria archaeon]
MKHYTCGSTDKGVTYFNYLDFEIRSVIAIIIIILSAIDYTQKRNNKGGIAISVILLIIGLIMLFLYNSYGSPLNQYHLYLFNIISYKSPYYVFWASKASALAKSVQGMVWGLTFGFGLFLLLVMLLNIYLIIKQNRK